VKPATLGLCLRTTNKFVQYDPRYQLVLREVRRGMTIPSLLILAQPKLPFLTFPEQNVTGAIDPSHWLWFAQMGLLDVLTDYAVGIADTVHARPVSCVCGALYQG
jgi:hypothetical protein